MNLYTYQSDDNHCNNIKLTIFVLETDYFKKLPYEFFYPKLRRELMVAFIKSISYIID